MKIQLLIKVKKSELLYALILIKYLKIENTKTNEDSVLKKVNLWPQFQGLEFGRRLVVFEFRLIVLSLH